MPAICTWRPRGWRRRGNCGRPTTVCCSGWRACITICSDTIRAEAFAQEAISLAPSEWLYHYLAGLAAKGAGQWPQARESLETAARLNASAAEVQNALGEVAQHDGDRESAIRAFRARGGAEAGGAGVSAEPGGCAGTETSRAQLPEDLFDGASALFHQAEGPAQKSYSIFL